MHVHQFLPQNGRNVFHDDGGPVQAQPAGACSYIGGLLSHPGSLVALTNPTTNSYRRLMPGFEAPVKAVFAEGNRSAAIRVPAYVKDPQERRFEFRTIDATCNPYLAYAAMIMAGLDGVRPQIDPVAAGFGPYETNLYDLPQATLDKIKSFPRPISKPPWTPCKPTAATSPTAAFSRSICWTSSSRPRGRTSPTCRRCRIRGRSHDITIFEEGFEDFGISGLEDPG